MNIDPTYVWKVTIESTKFKNVFLRIDSEGGVKYKKGGFGKVNCQYNAYSWEHYKISIYDDGSGNGICTIESIHFPNVFLRLDSEGGTSPSGVGFGKVNCQYGVGDEEKFIIEINFKKNEGFFFTFKSIKYPNVFIRLDSEGGSAPNDFGFGKVNCQYHAGSYETFFLKTIDKKTDLQSTINKDSKLKSLLNL